MAGLLRRACLVAALAISACGSGGSAEAPRSGLEVFADAGCGGCHRLTAARSTGTVASALDGRNLAVSEVERWVRTGGSGMPAFERQLSEEEIRAVSAFVAESTRIR